MNTKKAVRAALTLATSAMLLGFGVTPAQAEPSAEVCVRAHVAGVGTETAATCNSYDTMGYAGTVGQNRAIEGMWFMSHGFNGQVCVEVHIRNRGWIKEKCANQGTWFYVGTTGQNAPLEAIRVRMTSGLSVEGNAHVQGMGWQGWVRGGYIQIGTEGEARNLEAVSIRPA